MCFKGCLHAVKTVIYALATFPFPASGIARRRQKFDSGNPRHDAYGNRNDPVSEAPYLQGKNMPDETNQNIGFIFLQSTWVTKWLYQPFPFAWVA